MKRFKLFIGALLCLPLMVHAAETAEPPRNLFAEAHLGASKASQHGYEAAGTGQIAIGAKLTGMEITAGYSWLGKFDSKSIDDTHISVDALYLGLTKRFTVFSRFSLGPQVGAMLWNADVEFDGASKGSDDGSSLWLGISGQIRLLDRLAVNINTQRVNNVSGTDIYLISSGMVLRF